MAEYPLKNSELYVTSESVSRTSSSEKDEKCNEIFDNLVWLSSVEAAHYLRKSVGALRTAVSRGQIRARKWRRRLYFRKEELDRLLEDSQQLGVY